MIDLYVTLITDGPSDQVLLHHLTWLLRQHVRPGTSVQRQWADFRSLRQKPRGLREKIEAALDLYPCDLVFVHRDAEGEHPSRRREEIRRAVESLPSDVPPVVCVVPVRMTEAWLLFDEQAVRRAAGNPNGRNPIPVPAANAQDIPDPKTALRKALRSASGLTGRRRRKLNVRGAVYRVAEYIDDFSPLRRLTAFVELEQDLASTLQDLDSH